MTHADWLNNAINFYTRIAVFFDIYILRLLAHFADNITAYSETRYMHVDVVTTGSDRYCYSVAAMTTNNFAQLVTNWQK